MKSRFPTARLAVGAGVFCAPAASTAGLSHAGDVSDAHPYYGAGFVAAGAWR